MKDMSATPCEASRPGQDLNRAGNKRASNAVDRFDNLE
jgi:hypothetical protein